MTAIPQPSIYTPEQYLAWEAQQEGRHEYIEGVIYAMTGGSLSHNDIALNLYRLMWAHLKKNGCRVNVSDAKVMLAGKRAYFYPDLVVSCHPVDLRAKDVIQYPRLIVEVLSPSSAGYDCGEKFRYYREFPSLAEYVLIDAESVSVDVFQKSADGKWWLSFSSNQLADRLALKSIEWSCDLSAVYEGID